MPTNQIFEKAGALPKRQLENKGKVFDPTKPMHCHKNDDRNQGSPQFMDVVSWLRSVHSEMRFDNLGFNDDEGERTVKPNFMEQTIII